MIIYFDASSLVKLYVEEHGSEEVTVIFRSTRYPVASSIAYVEVHSALARSRRANRLSDESLRKAVRAFEGAWSDFAHIEVDQNIIDRAAKLARQYFLGSLDAMHLASAQRTQLGASETVAISSFDSDLLAAARAEGLAVSP